MKLYALPTTVYDHTNIILPFCVEGDDVYEIQRKSQDSDIILSFNRVGSVDPENLFALPSEHQRPVKEGEPIVYAFVDLKKDLPHDIMEVGTREEIEPGIRSRLQGDALNPIAKLCTADWLKDEGLVNQFFPAAKPRLASLKRKDFYPHKSFD